MEKVLGLLVFQVHPNSLVDSRSTVIWNIDHMAFGIFSQEAFDTTNRFQCLLCGPMQERQSGDKDHKPNPVVQSSRDARR